MKVSFFELRLKPARRGGNIALPRRHAVTLLELLVVVGAIALLLGLLLPGLARARDHAKSAVCTSNIRQLALANTMYAQDSDGVFVPGAAEIKGSNLQRWHGARKKTSDPFDSSRGPLAAYLGVDATVRACPTFAPDKPGFERGNGGYGYNNAYVGVQMILDPKGTTAGVWLHQIKRPADTLMFADSAFVNGSLIEYSFAEPRFHPQFVTRADPSIHFRHVGHANIAWCDGHVSAERRTFTSWSGLYEGDPQRHNIGWFGDSDDNTYFDLQ